jgi:membrane-associated phospholipid phosphatase
MHFKRKYNRARPVQVYPALMPIAPTPGHPSYPSSHALQAHLITACLAEFVPAAMLVPLQTLAERVSVNREIAGVHFPSDTQASVTLVPDLHRKLQQGKMYQQLIAEAHKEWS